MSSTAICGATARATVRGTDTAGLYATDDESMDKDIELREKIKPNEKRGG